MRGPRRIDWRWAAASDATALSPSEAEYQLGGYDNLTREAYKFKRALDDGLDIQKYDAIAEAYSIFSSRQWLKLGIEGLFLADVADDIIADACDLNVGDVLVYHDLFFDVRSRIKKPIWVAEQLFAGSIYHGVSSYDKVACMHRIAWLGGADIFWSFYTGKRDMALRQNSIDLMKDILIKRSILHSLCVQEGADGVEMLKVVMLETEKDLAKIAETTGDSNMKAIGEFINTFSMTVADPTQSANLLAREPRAADYLKELHVISPDVVPA